MNELWGGIERPAPQSVVVGGVELRRGSRVRLRPRPGGEILDLALAGKTAIVMDIEQDYEDRIHLAVTVEDDPGRDFGEAKQPGHRFYFAVEEVEPMAQAEPLPARRILVAGIGNIFLGDDGFGVEVARRLMGRALPAGVEVVDFGIRGLDLAFALQDGYDTVVLVDAAPRGGEPGTLYVIEPEEEDGGDVVLETHGMDPVKVLRLARAMGGVPTRMLVVGCEPRSPTGDDPDAEMQMGLSAPVAGAVGEAVKLVESLVEGLAAPVSGRETPSVAAPEDRGEGKGADP